MAETKRETRFVVQYEYESGQLGSKFWHWQDHHKTFDTIDQARTAREAVEAKHEANPSKFQRGPCRIVERVTVTTETVVD